MRRAVVAGLSVVTWTAPAAATSAAVAGCVIEAAPLAGGGALAVGGPPPAPMREQRDARSLPPDARVVWIAGYWHWTGVQYAWIPGHWENAPPGSAWRAPHYSLRDGTYFYEPGAWVGR